MNVNENQLKPNENKEFQTDNDKPNNKKLKADFISEDKNHKKEMNNYIKEKKAKEEKMKKKEEKDKKRKLEHEIKKQKENKKIFNEKIIYIIKIKINLFNQLLMNIQEIFYSKKISVIKESKIENFYLLGRIGNIDLSIIIEKIKGISIKYLLINKNIYALIDSAGNQIIKNDKYFKKGNENKKLKKKIMKNKMKIKLKIK